MKSRILAFIAIAATFLIVQNLFAQGMMNHKMKGDNHPMFQKLNLTEEQQDQISTLKLNHQMEMIDLKANLEKRKVEMAELKHKGNYTREEYINKVVAINSAKDQISISKANFQMDVYQLLDDAQKAEWNKYSQFFGERKVKQMMRQMRENKVE
jgi:Spy/CpxP family protein refolding chaperone